MYESCFFFFDLKTDECASWVQAWGTIAAVIATGFFTWLQHRFDLERDRVAEREKSVRLIKLGISSAQGVDLPGFFGPIVSRKMAPNLRGVHEKEPIHRRADGHGAA